MELLGCSESNQINNDNDKHCIFFELYMGDSVLIICLRLYKNKLEVKNDQDIKIKMDCGGKLFK